MARFAFFVVLSALGALGAVAAQAERPEGAESAEGGHQNAIKTASYDARRRREEPKTGNSNTQFIRSEKTTTGDHIIWRDNSETRRAGRVPTVTKVLYHGIYPSLNVTVPLNETGKYRQRRGLGWDGSTGGESGEPETRNHVAETQQYSDSTPQTAYPRPKYPPTKKHAGGNHYLRADHRRDPLENAYVSGDKSVSQYAQGSIKYRTMYFPSGQEYRGDPENKGHVRLISVGYYSVNESTAHLRSYRNPKVERNRPTHRVKRDAHWCWLDKLLEAVWIVKHPDGKQQNEMPGSEPFKLNVAVNEEAQDVYGYSSNGNAHHHLDEIYLVSNQIGNSLSEDPEHFETPKTELPQPEVPTTETVLLQAPQRLIACRPPKRYARGRCRTVW